MKFNKKLYNLRESVQGNLYDIFLKSDYTKWETTGYNFKYSYKNMTFAIINVHNNDNCELEMIILKTGNDKYAKAYKLMHNLNYTWFSSSKRKKVYKKYLMVVNYYKEKEEYDELKLAFDMLPVKIQRKSKLYNISNVNLDEN